MITIPVTLLAFLIITNTIVDAVMLLIALGIMILYDVINKKKHAQTEEEKKCPYKIEKD